LIDVILIGILLLFWINSFWVEVVVGIPIYIILLQLFSFLFLGYILYYINGDIYDWFDCNLLYLLIFSIISLLLIALFFILINLVPPFSLMLNLQWFFPLIKLVFSYLAKQWIFNYIFSWIFGLIFIGIVVVLKLLNLEWILAYITYIISSFKLYSSIKFINDFLSKIPFSSRNVIAGRSSVKGADKMKKRIRRSPHDNANAAIEGRRRGTNPRLADKLREQRSFRDWEKRRQDYYNSSSRHERRRLMPSLRYLRSTERVWVPMSSYEGYYIYKMHKHYEDSD
jgi:signal transduction histidine kinase